MPKKIRVLLVQGGPSSEHAVSLESAKMISAALNAERYSVQVATVTKDGRWNFERSKKRYQAGAALNEIEHRKFDVAFIALHGSFGEDGKIQALFESIGLPYTGSGVETSAVAMNKTVSSLLFEKNGLHTPAFVHVMHSTQKTELKSIPLPAVVKPCHGGSSVGISIVKSFESAWRATRKILKTGDTAIIQCMIKGREFTCGILDDAWGNPQPLPPTEIVPIKGKFFDFESKYDVDGSKEITPPNIPEALLKTIQQAALRAHTILGCSGMSRADFIHDGKKLYILEINTIPGMTKTSLLPQEAQAEGISFSDMLDRIIQTALMHAGRSTRRTVRVTFP